MRTSVSPPTDTRVPHKTMGFLTSVLRLSVPAGAVYWSIQERIWSPVSATRDGQEKLEEKNQQLMILRNKVLQSIDPHVRPYLTAVTSSKWMQIPDPRNYWNCGVKMVFRKMADLDVGKQLERLSQVLKDQMTSNPTEEKNQTS